MDHNIDNRYKEILWDLLANPAENGRSQKPSLERLVQDNPQSGLLQVMFARTSETPDIRKASAYFTPKALYKVIHDPDGLLPVARERVNKAQNGNQPVEPENYFNIGHVTEEEAEAQEAISDEPVAEEESLVPQEVAQPVDNFAPTEETEPVTEELPPALPAHEDEKYFSLPDDVTEDRYEILDANPVQQETPVEEAIERTETIEAPAEEQEEIAEAPAEEPQAESIEETPAPVEQPQTYYTPPTPVSYASTHADEDEGDDNPWDFSKLEGPAPEVAVESEPEEEQPVAKAEPEAEHPIAEVLPEAETATEEAPEPESTQAESQPEVASKTPAEEPAAEQPEETEPQQAPVTPVHEFGIPTYDHSLSAYEQAAISEAADTDKAGPEVSSFEYPAENVFHHQGDIEDDVYDEIVSIDDIGVESLNNTFAEDPDNATDLDLQEDTETDTTESHFDPDTERLIYGNIAATDYLSFDKKLDELRNGFDRVAASPEATETPSAPEPETVQEVPTIIPEAEQPQVEEEPVANAQETEQPVIQETPAPVALEETQQSAQPITAEAVIPVAQATEPAKDPEVISRYDDDTMPYSFMWWLDKTRKEHASANQPYAQAATSPAAEQQAAKAAPAGDPLQQQYFENIFTLTSVSSIGDAEPPKIEFNPEKKEDVIIERFISTDPQIKPLSADKLDTENKAKRSSEDQDAMVTETLARIYSDQMLYHKAIATYKKLMLKFPEKNSYFAAQIEQLEKKIN